MTDSIKAFVLFKYLLSFTPFSLEEQVFKLKSCFDEEKGDTVLFDFHVIFFQGVLQTLQFVNNQLHDIVLQKRKPVKRNLNIYKPKPMKLVKWAVSMYFSNRTYWTRHRRAFTTK